MKLDIKQIAKVTKELNKIESPSKDSIITSGVGSTILLKMLEHVLFEPSFDYDEEAALDDQALNTELILTELINLEIIKLD